MRFLPVCKACRGTGTDYVLAPGWYEGVEDWPIPCEYCRGTGYSTRIAQAIYKLYINYRVWRVTREVRAVQYQVLTEHPLLATGVEDPFAE